MWILQGMIRRIWIFTKENGPLQAENFAIWRLKNADLTRENEPPLGNLFWKLGSWATNFERAAQTGQLGSFWADCTSSAAGESILELGLSKLGSWATYFERAALIGQLSNLF